MADPQRQGRTQRLLARAMRAFLRRVPPLRRLEARATAALKRARYRRRAASLPIDTHAVVFEAYAGSSYACSPRAIYEALLRDERFSEFSFTWVFDNPTEYSGLPAFARASTVARNTRAHLDALASSKYWICNTAVPQEVTPREGQVYLQTWHGTPFKHFGLDIVPPGMTSSRAIAERNARWRASARKFTHVLSQSPFATAELARALGVEASRVPTTFLELGYPRNDALANATPHTVGSIRERLGLAADKKLVLYAPTWRDEQRTRGVGYTLELGLDFERLRRDLGDEYVILFRAHFMVAQEFDFEKLGGFVRDVSSVDDISELYLVADILVTDYSSVFFDYANLERPTIFYLYDLERYAGARGGLCLELEELPGPVVRSQDSLADAIRRASQPTAADALRYRAFREKFAPRDDGRASERVIDEIFGTKERTCQ